MKTIKKSPFSRGLSIAKLGLKAGTRAAGNYVSGGNQEDYLISQMKMIAEEFGELKGTMMKVGQSLSTYGEHFLPPKANAFLKELQFKSPPMDWEAIETLIEKELGLSVFLELDIDEKALAAASLGQVHKAVHKKTGAVYAMKVQYPGVSDAIESDVKNLKRIFSLAKVLPKALNLDEIFDEVKTMLYQETNYTIESSWTQKIHLQLKNDDRFLSPEVIPQYSTSKILTTRFIEGETLDSKKVLSLPQEERDFIGSSFLEHYINELFKYKAVQTDPHLGNYRVQIQKNGRHKLVLFDFGAMRVVPDDFSKNFKSLVLAGALDENSDDIIKYATNLGYLMNDDSEELKNSFVQVCNLITEPFRSTGSEFHTKEGGYLWKKTNLPKRVAKSVAYIAKNFKLRVPPRESVFLDRKLGGAFIFLSVIDFQGNTNTLLKELLKKEPAKNSGLS